MDVNKLRADLEASQALNTEAKDTITALNGDLTAKDAEITKLRADLDAANAKSADAERALATAHDEHKLATAKLEGRLEEAQGQITRLQAEAKTVGHKAADITRSRSFDGDMDSTPDGSQRSAEPGTQRPESLQERTAAAFKAMAAPFFNPKSA
jgi:chromosome segregation ATPase